MRGLFLIVHRFDLEVGVRRIRRARTGRVRGRRDAGRPRPGRDAKERGAPVAARVA
ncbi:hypothetical protein BUH_1285 [Burkholderia pseudomallei Pakistan 9]|nr:hypothetical protein BURPSPAST_AA0031 [Burkholderia pseudomallei Pasteur 52237]EEH25419.1 hypothetical protein BUH_1285 [Burkholderia pseudomallei Pakistan 9]